MPKPSDANVICTLEYRIPASIIQNIVKDFTLSQRYFTAYTADKLELMIKYSLHIDLYWRMYDTDTEEVVMSCQADEVNYRKFPNLYTHKSIGAPKLISDGLLDNIPAGMTLIDPNNP
jgi:hypothetical protein